MECSRITTTLKFGTQTSSSALTGIATTSTGTTSIFGCGTSPPPFPSCIILTIIVADIHMIITLLRFAPSTIRPIMLFQQDTGTNIGYNMRHVQFTLGD